ncbi:MAG: phosphodiester glycosidase family protein [Rubrobacter sp.]|nr:phosphodiester glycosidase family protein [Rubrobacter sp.]
MSAAALMLGNGPLQSLGARAALGQEMPSAMGYGPLVLKTDGENSLRLPVEFNFQTISRQGDPQRDGNPTPGIFDERRNPRTLAGTTPGGDLLLVAVDGRRPGYSVGASFEESAGIMDALGSGEAVNLDGGGSTGMTVRQTLVTQPSDTTGERPIGDAVVLLP